LRGKRVGYSAAQLAEMAIVGVLLLMGGNLTLSYAEQHVASGLAALIVAITPLWFLVLDSLLLGHHRISSRGKFGLAMLFISHDLAVVSQVAERVAVMYAGNLVELGSKRNIFTAPAHPYTRGLLQAVPTLRTDRNQPLRTIEGTVPPLQALPPGCPFEPRCEMRVEECGCALPALVEISRGHWARCPVTAPSTR